MGGDRAVDTPQRTPRDNGSVIARFVAACSADDRIVAAFLHGSYARGEADGHSDLDLALVTTDDARAQVWSDRADLIHRLGQPLFLEDFGSDVTCFFVLADGTEGELSIGRESRPQEIHEGAFQILLDKKGILTNSTFPAHHPDPAEQTEALRRILFWFWHELSHLTAALGRGQLWWAYGQLDAMRGMCVNLTRIEQGVPALEEPYEKVDRAISMTELSALRSTFCPMERGAMVQAGRDILRFYRERAPLVAQARGVPYPAELDRLMSERFHDLAGPLG